MSFTDQSLRRTSYIVQKWRGRGGDWAHSPLLAPLLVALAVLPPPRAVVRAANASAQGGRSRQALHVVARTGEPTLRPALGTSSAAGGALVLPDERSGGPLHLGPAAVIGQQVAQAVGERPPGDAHGPDGHCIVGRRVTRRARPMI